MSRTFTYYECRERDLTVFRALLGQLFLSSFRALISLSLSLSRSLLLALALALSAGVMARTTKRVRKSKVPPVSGRTASVSSSTATTTDSTGEPAAATFGLAAKRGPGPYRNSYAAFKPKRANDKKSRRLAKSAQFAGRLASEKAIRVEAAAAKERSKRAIVGDLMPLQRSILDALSSPPPPDGMINGGGRRPRDPMAASKRRTTRRRGRTVTLFQESRKFAGIMAHPGFRAAPAAAITEHLRNTVNALNAQEDEAAGEGRRSKARAAR